MSIPKILFLLFLAWLGWRIYKGYKFFQMLKQQATQTKPLQASLCQCVHCGVHLPENEAIFDGSNVYCCVEHQRKGPKVS